MKTKNRGKAKKNVLFFFLSKDLLCFSQKCVFFQIEPSPRLRLNLAYENCNQFHHEYITIYVLIWQLLLDV